MLFPRSKPRPQAQTRQADKSTDGWLGTPVLIPGEDAIAFEQFAARIRAALQAVERH